MRRIRALADSLGAGYPYTQGIPGRRAFTTSASSTPTYSDEKRPIRQMTPLAAGYSGTPLAKKLGIKDGTRLLPVHAPKEYASWLGTLPTAASLVSRVGPSVDIVHVFAIRRAALERDLKRFRRALRPDAALWVSWPKKSSKVPTDLTEDGIRAVALPLGFVDIKVCAVTDIWSGLKLVVRKELR